MRLCSQPYVPPEWVVSRRNLSFVPTHKANLAHFPTPIQRWSFRARDKDYNLYIKRDDLSEMSASGNKVRKLEFIMPEVERGAHDWVVTVGGTQSNHCRAVAAICARSGIKCAVVLRKDFYFNEDRPNDGNMFFHTIYGSHVFYVTKEEYARKGQHQLLKETSEKLISDYGASNPYLLPVGGSILPGVYGYIECIRELEVQLDELAKSGHNIDEIIFSCGSGGTASGLAIGKYLSTSPLIKRVKLTAYLACDSPEYFHEHVNEMLAAIGLGSEVTSEELIEFVQAKGAGYAINTEQELSVIKDIARSSGIILDASYTGKALSKFTEDTEGEEGKERREDGHILFLHTGGMFSLFGHEELWK